jgi:FAD/FMN-containing dehydrogenase
MSAMLDSGRLDTAAIRALARQIKGSVHLPGEAAYDEACRIWNAMIERRPALVVRPAEDADVAAAIGFARAHGLPLSVRGGGHNVAGAALSDGGVTIDMSQRRGVTVDAEERLVRVEPGATWKDVDVATQPHGLVVPSGIISATGVAGLTLGAGFGWTSRKFGFTADNLVAADVVTADGRMLRASADENPDLFWALRGGGGNFAVVTGFEFRAHPHGPQALCGMVVHPFERADAVMELFRSVTANAPDELTCLLVLRRAPPAPFIPAELHGKPIAAIAAHWTGDPAEGAEAMRPLKDFGPPVADTIAPKDFLAFQTFLDGGQPFGRRYYWKSHETGEISDALTTTLAASAARIASPFSAILTMHMGGAPARVPPAATAVGIRGARYAVVVQSAWEDPAEDDVHIGWARDTFNALQPHASGAAYVNFLTAEESEARMSAAYGAAVYERLRRVKAAYDPENLLRGNLNIPPLRTA